MSELLGALWFFLPAGLANGAPVFAAKLPWIKHLGTPLDLGKEINGVRLFGNNKTWRGLIAGMVVATIVLGLQKYLFTNTAYAAEISWFDYQPQAIWLLGPLFGAGALLADAAESYLKRRRRIAPGESWFPFDQIDYIIGGCLFSFLIVQLTLIQYLWVFAVWFGIHLITVYLGFRLGIRERAI